MATILNLGCGTKTNKNCINIDWGIYGRIKRNRLGRRVAPVIFNGARLANYNKLDDGVVVHDLRKGIPVADRTADVVYHSQFLEHFDRDAAPGFLAEVRRVLKPGGIHRIVVPDLEDWARRYLASLERGLHDSEARASHDSDVVTELLVQIVRREAWGTSVQRPLRRRLENLLLGDARKRGETHQWMWDRVSLGYALEQTGHHDVQVLDYQTSRFPGWTEIGLDQDEDGAEYSPESMYIEALA